MKASQLVSLLNGLDYKIKQFDITKMVDKVQNKELSKEQIEKLKQDVFDLEEDLIILDCDK